MSKPDDIPQDVWDIAWKLQGNTEYDEAAIRGAAYPELLRACENDAAAIARAILAAKAEEREACAELCGGLRHDDRSSENEDWVAGTFACQTAIRKRGEP